jgi:hypothetical protein
MWDTPGMYEFFGWKLKFSQHYLGTNEQCIIESEYRFSEAEIGLIEIIVSRTVAQSLSALYFRSCAASRYIAKEMSPVTTLIVTVARGVADGEFGSKSMAERCDCNYRIERLQTVVVASVKSPTGTSVAPPDR